MGESIFNKRDRWKYGIPDKPKKIDVKEDDLAKYVGKWSDEISDNELTSLFATVMSRATQEEKQLTKAWKKAYNKLKGYADLFKAELQGFNKISKPISTNEKREVNQAIQELLPELITKSTNKMKTEIDENSRRI